MAEREIYLDNAATTKPYPEAILAMARCLAEDWGNPAGLYGRGRAAYQAMAAAREEVARLIGAAADEIYFTSGGTEADNLAIAGVAGRFAAGHIITSAIEHKAVLNCVRHLQEQGYAADFVAPDERGIVAVADIVAALRPDTLLVSLMLANNEVGTIQPVADLARKLGGRGIILHTDAVQAVGKLPLNVGELGVDMLSISAHKINGPKGVGALYVRHGADTEPILFGGAGAWFKERHGESSCYSWFWRGGASDPFAFSGAAGAGGGCAGGIFS